MAHNFLEHRSCNAHFALGCYEVMRDNPRLLILAIEDDTRVTPCVPEQGGDLFLKTVLPSRKHTAIHLGSRTT